MRDSALVLNLLRYEHELRSTDDLELPDTKSVKLTEAELRMAERLIGEMEGAWNPDRFQDEYHDEVLALVDRKVRSGQTHVVLEPEAAPKRARARSDVVDLMPLLKKSLEARASGDKAARGSTGRGHAKRKPARSKAPARKKRTA